MLLLLMFVEEEEDQATGAQVVHLFPFEDAAKKIFTDRLATSQAQPSPETVPIQPRFVLRHCCQRMAIREDQA